MSEQMVVKKTKTLHEKCQELENEFTQLTRHREDLIAKQKETYNEYHRLITEYNELLQLREDDKAKEMEPKLRELRQKEDDLKIEVSGIGSHSLEKIKEAAAKHPESRLHKLGEAIQNDGIVTMKVLEDNLKLLINDDLEKAKKRYLGLVQKAGEMYRKLFETYKMVKGAEGVLSPEKHISKKPQAAPEWAFFDIEDEVGKAYGNRPFL